LLKDFFAVLDREEILVACRVRRTDSPCRGREQALTAAVLRRLESMMLGDVTVVSPVLAVEAEVLDALSGERRGIEA
jgi:hypothetical protein